MDMRIITMDMRIITMDIMNKFYIACANDNLDEAKRLVKKGLNLPLSRGWALHIAAKHKSFKIIDYLIEYQAHHKCTSYGWALKWAMENDYFETVMHLRKVIGDEWLCHTCLVRSTCMVICDDMLNI
jgi:hypothetical protein